MPAEASKALLAARIREQGGLKASDPNRTRPAPLAKAPCAGGVKANVGAPLAKSTGKGAGGGGVQVTAAAL